MSSESQVVRLTVGSALLWGLIPTTLFGMNGIFDLLRHPGPHAIAFLGTWPLAALILYFAASTKVSATGVTRPFVGSMIEWSNISTVAEGKLRLTIGLAAGGRAFLLKGLRRRELQAAVERFAPEGHPLRHFLSQQ